MKCNTIDILTLIIPGLVAIIGNIIFYAIVKNRIDKSIEKHKISYAGIYQEKIQIHKDLLKWIYDLKLKIQQFQYSGDQKLGEELFLDFNNFIGYYQRNQPFIKDKILERLRELTTELQGCFDDFYMHNSLAREKGIQPEIRQETLTKFFESGNKFKKNEPFKQIEIELIQEMKKDLRIKE